MKKEIIDRILMHLAILYTYIYITILVERKELFLICGISVPIQIWILACIGLLFLDKKEN